MSVLFDRVVLRAPGMLAHRPWTVELGAGTHALVLPSPEAAAETARLVSGVESPQRGRVLAFSQEPFATPALRAHTGCTFRRDFAGVTNLTARAYWERARALRAEHGAIMAEEPLGLLSSEHFEQALVRLGARQRAALELELALALKSPKVLWLCEPPRLDTEASFDRVLGGLRDRGRAGAVVVVTVQSRREAGLWGESVHTVPEAPPRPAVVTLELVLERAREVAAELQAEPAVLSTAFDPARPDLLLVSGTDELALRHACARAVVARQVELREMVSRPTPRTGERQVAP